MGQKVKGGGKVRGVGKVGDVGKVGNGKVRIPLPTIRKIKKKI